MDAYLPRIAESSLRAAMQAAPVVILDGPRAAGKTTTARRWAASEVLLPRDLEVLRADPAGYLSALQPPVLIDEWQLAGVDLLWTIKQAVDENPSPGRFLLTGSVEPATYGPTYPLTGRSVRVVLRPMSRCELQGHGAAATFLSRVVDGEDPAPTGGAAGAYEPEWLLESGFPASRTMPEPGLFLEAYAATVAQRAGEEGRDATRMLRTLRVLAVLEGQAVPDQRIWSAADVNKVTWKAYDDLLQRVHIAVPLPSFETNRLTRLTAYPKRLLADVAMSLTLAQVSSARLASDPRLAGAYFESFVVQQLRPQADAIGAGLSHLRTGAGEREVDTVVEVADRLIAFEAKHAVRPTREDASGMAWLRDQFPDRFQAGYVVHTGGDVYPLGPRLWALPVSVLTG